MNECHKVQIIKSHNPLWQLEKQDCQVFSSNLHIIRESCHVLCFSALWRGGSIPYDPQGKLGFEHPSGTQVFATYGSYFSSLQNRENAGSGRMLQPHENCSDILENVTMVSFVVVVLNHDQDSNDRSASPVSTKARTETKARVPWPLCRSTMQICKVSSTAMKNDLLLNRHFHCPLSIPWWAAHHTTTVTWLHLLCLLESEFLTFLHLPYLP